MDLAVPGPASGALAFVLLLAVGFLGFVWWLWRDGGDPSGALTGATLIGRRPRARGDSVLFICTRNSARSQMAEALLRARTGEWFDTASAGTDPGGTVHPLTVRVMAEIGINISRARTRTIDEVGDRWDYVITVCDAANERCPEFPPKTSRLHWSLPDPAAVEGTETDRVQAFRAVRDDLRRRIGVWVAERRTR